MIFIYESLKISDEVFLVRFKKNFDQFLLFKLTLDFISFYFNIIYISENVEIHNTWIHWRT